MVRAASKHLRFGRGHSIAGRAADAATRAIQGYPIFMAADYLKR